MLQQFVVITYSLTNSHIQSLNVVKHSENTNIHSLVQRLLIISVLYLLDMRFQSPLST